MTFYYEIPKSPYDVRDFTITAETDLPKAFALDVQVPVKNQGMKPTCTAHASSSVVEYHHKRQHNEYREFSTEFLYGVREKDYYVGDGMVIRDCLKTLQKYGDTYESDCKGNHDYEKAMENVSERIEDLKELAFPHRISAYFKINTADELKTALMKYGPVVVSMYVHYEAKLVKDVYTFDPGAKRRGAHCVFIYGWNEQGWLVQNSWGIFYGGDGRFVIPFDFKFIEMWGIIDEITEGVLVKPKRNTILDVFYSIWNNLINFILRLNKKP